MALLAPDPPREHLHRAPATVAEGGSGLAAPLALLKVILRAACPAAGHVQNTVQVPRAAPSTHHQRRAGVVYREALRRLQDEAICVPQLREVPGTGHVMDVRCSSQARAQTIEATGVIRA